MTANGHLDRTLVLSPDGGRGKEMMCDLSLDRIVGSGVIAEHQERRNGTGAYQAGPRMLMQLYDSFRVTKPRDPNPTNAINPAPNNQTAAGNGTSEFKAPCTR